VIVVAGEVWGTAAEIGNHLGVSEAVVRSWARPGRGDLIAVRGEDDKGRPQVWYSLGQAVVIDRSKRHGGRGRRRADVGA
jgi:hypothetical protein